MKKEHFSINILINNTKYYFGLQEFSLYFLISFLIKFKIDIRKFIYFIFKLLKKNNSYPLFFLKFIFIKLLIYSMKFVKGKKYFYKQYKSGRKLRISKKLYLKHFPENEQKYIKIDSEVEEILDDEYPKSILKNNYKRVFFNDDRNEIREYFLSKEEKYDKYLAYKKIKKRNKV